MIPDRIRVDAPSSDARRDRVEREVFTRLAALRLADHAGVAPRRRPRWYALAVPAASVASLAIAAVIVLGRAPAAPTGGAPSLVVTPVGGSSRFTVGDAVIDAGSDTSVEVARTGDAVTLVVQRGSIDCDVTPRPGRAPFRVISGDVHVEVIGTRFAVTRLPDGTRVDVTRGKVRVRAPAGERLLGGGESWTAAALTATAHAGGRAEAPPPAEAPAPAEPAPAEPAPAEPAPAAGELSPNASTPRAEPPRRTRREEFARAQRLEAKDPRQAARGYRLIADGRDAWAALALYSLAELHTASDPALALDALDELARRFPNAANAEDAAWLRVDLLRRLGRTDETRAAAAAYLRAFPRGTYANAAGRLAEAK